MVKTLATSGYEICVEIGSQPALFSIHTGSSPLPMRLESNYSQMLHCLGELYLQGVAINWSGFDQDYSRRLVELPTYPFQRQRYWFEPN